MNNGTNDCICQARNFRYFAQHCYKRQLVLNRHPHGHTANGKELRKRRYEVYVWVGICEHLHKTTIQVKNLHHLAIQYLLISVFFVLLFKIGHLLLAIKNFERYRECHEIQSFQIKTFLLLTLIALQKKNILGNRRVTQES